MRFLLGVLVGYCLRGKQRLLIATLTAIAVGCFIVLPAIALSLLALDVRRERLSRPPQTTVPVVVGLNYTTAEMKLRNASLNIRVLANRSDLPLEPRIIIAQLKYSELARVSINVLADDTRELKFPENWKRPRRVTDLLMQQRRVRIQNRIDDLRGQLSRSL